MKVQEPPFFHSLGIAGKALSYLSPVIIQGVMGHLWVAQVLLVADTEPFWGHGYADDTQVYLLPPFINPQS